MQLGIDFDDRYNTDNHIFLMYHGKIEWLADSKKYYFHWAKDIEKLNKPSYRILYSGFGLQYSWQLGYDFRIRRHIKKNGKTYKKSKSLPLQKETERNQH